MAGRLPIVLVHGYSDKGASFQRWREVLQDCSSELQPSVLTVTKAIGLSVNFWWQSLEQKKYGWPR